MMLLRILHYISFSIIPIAQLFYHLLFPFCPLVSHQNQKYTIFSSLFLFCLSLFFFFSFLVFIFLTLSFFFTVLSFFSFFVLIFISLTFLIFITFSEFLYLF